MKIRVFTYRVFSLLILLVNACQASGTTPTSTSLPQKVESPTVAPTEIAPTLTIPAATSTPETPAGQVAYTHVEAISEQIGSRVAGAEKEEQTAQYIVSQFEQLGYTPELRPFMVTVKGNVINSANVIAIKQGASPAEIIVGAHYDSVSAGRGADDNATGVAVILEVAEHIRRQNTPYSIRFILFGAEEAGLQGSKYYVSQMTEETIQNTIGMINLDGLTAGDIAYIYGDEGEQGAIRDWALAYASDHGLKLQIQPGEHPDYPAGATGDWSDHAPFKEVGIRYTYLESTNWSLGDKDGYTQVSTEYGENGEIWHTEYDTLEYINTTFPGRVQERLHLFVTVLEAILTEYRQIQ